jgi:hypothetical protein
MMLKRETSTLFLFPVASQEMCQYLSLVTLELYLRQNLYAQNRSK